MAKITNQWLNRGQGRRSRSFSPVNVEVNAVNPSTTWSKQNGIAVEITAKRVNQQYQELYLTTADAEKVAQSVLQACGDEYRLRVAEELLDRISDADLH